MAHFCVPMLAVLTLLVVAQGVAAKRGCSAFGHSCYGGHGKRSSNPGLDESNQELQNVRRQFGQEETPPQPGYPHSEPGADPGDNMIPVRDGGVYEDDGPMIEMMKQLRIRNIFKHWMDNYRRIQQTNEGGLFGDNV